MSLALNSYNISGYDSSEPIAFETQIKAVDMAIENLAKTARLNSLPISIPFIPNNHMHIHKPVSFNIGSSMSSSHGPTLSYTNSQASTTTTTGTTNNNTPPPTSSTYIPGRVFQPSTAAVQVKFDPFEPITGSISLNQSSLKPNTPVAGLFGSPSDTLKWANVWGKPVSAQVRG